ncbi:MAG: hypothetical protein EOP48_21870, partial [Sphingobacteriales bacterium]
PLAYELELPPSLSIHPVFHISKLRRFVESEQFDVFRPPAPARPPPDVEGSDEVYEVEAIHNHRKKKWRGDGRMYNQYLVKWKDYPEFENTWEWEDSLGEAKEIVDAYVKGVSAGH